MLAATATQTQTTVLSIVISLAVLAFLMYRQLQVRPVRTTFALPVVLIIVGVASLSGGGPNGLGSAGRVAILVALLVGDAAGLGAVRALTVRLWRNGDVVLRQGTWVTMALWIVGVAIHALVGALANISDSTLLLYMGITLGAQQLVVQARARQPERLPQRGAAGASWQS